jgi:ribonuclease E
MGKISRFGLMELSRQRLRPSLGESSYSPCPRCHGTGHIRGTESTALHILRIIQEEAMKENTAAVHAQVPVDVATFLLNEKRVDLQMVEARHRVTVTLIPNTHLETPNYSVTRLRHDDLNQSEPLPASYNLVEAPAEEAKPAISTGEAAPARPVAAVRGITPQQPAPVMKEEPAAAAAPAPTAVSAPTQEPSILSRIFGWFRSTPTEGTPVPAPQAAEPVPQRPVEPAPREAERPREGRGRDRERERGGRPRGEGGPQQAAEHRRGREHGRQRHQEERRHEGRRHEGRRDESAPERLRQREEASAEATPRPSVAPTVEPGGSREPGEGRGRRRRGRRDRHEHREESTGAEQRGRATPALSSEAMPDDAAAPGATAVAATTITVSQADLSTPAQAASVAAVLEESPAAATPLIMYPTTAAAIPVPEALPAPQPLSPPPEPVAAPVAVAAEESVREVMTPRPEQAVAARPEQVLTLDWQTDLTQVETSPEKLQAARTQAPEEIGVPRPRRVRPVLAPVAEEPLLQVETRRPDSTTPASGG